MVLLWHYPCFQAFQLYMAWLSNEAGRLRNEAVHLLGRSSVLLASVEEVPAVDDCSKQ